MRIRTNAFFVPFGYQVRAKFFAHVNQGVLRITPKVETLVSAFYRGGNPGTERPPDSMARQRSNVEPGFEVSAVAI